MSLTARFSAEFDSAMKRGENIVELGDGSLGLLPEEWLKKYGLLAGLGAAAGTARYARTLCIQRQAIDRAHRIGRTKNVFACRLITRGTVEEKVLELQNSKRELADAIINADNSLIRSLARGDLELLLS
ncbi:MAG: hypothetical protein ACJ74G_20975 [Blastocatellia bacterium]